MESGATLKTTPPPYQYVRRRSRLHPFLAVLALLAVCGRAHPAEGFSFSATEPDFNVFIPNVPPLVLGAHPLHAAKPHLRTLGSDGPYTVSVMTPTADPGMTPAECASASIRSLTTRPGGPPPADIYRARLNEKTYVAIYAAPAAGFMHLHAHFLSAAGGRHCIEVHVSKASTSKEDVEPWFRGFGAARIESK